MVTHSTLDKELDYTANKYHDLLVENCDLKNKNTDLSCDVNECVRLHQQLETVKQRYQSIVIQRSDLLLTDGNLMAKVAKLEAEACSSNE